MARYWWMVGLLLGTVALSGCGKAEPPLVGAGATAPGSVRWERAEQGGLGSVEVPAGEGWAKEAGPGLQVHNEKLDITVMVQHQAAVPVEARSEYLSSLIDVNKRDAPKYEVTAKAEGGVNQHVAGRVDGKFDNGTTYTTRDYVLFVKDSALALMVRGPALEAQAVQGIANHVAVSYR